MKLEIVLILTIALFITISVEYIRDMAHDTPTPVQFACPDPEIGQLGKHKYVTVMGSAYKVNRLPGGSYEIIGKLGRYVEVGR